MDKVEVGQLRVIRPGYLSPPGTLYLVVAKAPPRPWGERPEWTVLVEGKLTEFDEYYILKDEVVAQ